jgi:SAM-dependent methyltransferase
MESKDSTRRFSNRVDDYTRYRPTYPAAIITLLEKELGLQPEHIVADIGSGTGLSSIPFLRNGNTVYGVEPNREMRQMQEHLLHDFPTFRSIDGTAEHTTLLDHSVEVVLSAQAFHWFDKQAYKIECARILKENGHIVLVWNARSTKSPFQSDYEQVLYDQIQEYKAVNHRNIQDLDIMDFFSPKTMKHATLDHKQLLDLDGLKGRLKSSSYCPKEGPKYETLMRGMEDIFAKHQQDEQISFCYETLIYWC